MEQARKKEKEGKTKAEGTARTKDREERKTQ